MATATKPTKRPIALILCYESSRKQCEMVISEAMRLLAGKAHYEIMDFEQFMGRWGAYDWDSDAFRKVFARHYHHVSIYGGLLTEDKERYLQLATALGWELQYNSHPRQP